MCDAKNRYAGFGRRGHLALADEGGERQRGGERAMSRLNCAAGQVEERGKEGERQGKVTPPPALSRFLSAKP